MTIKNTIPGSLLKNISLRARVRWNDVYFACMIGDYTILRGDLTGDGSYNSIVEF